MDNKISTQNYKMMTRHFRGLPLFPFPWDCCEVFSAARARPCRHPESFLSATAFLAPLPRPLLEVFPPRCLFFSASPLISCPLSSLSSSSYSSSLSESDDSFFFLFLEFPDVLAAAALFFVVFLGAAFRLSGSSLPAWVSQNQSDYPTIFKRSKEKPKI